MIHSTIPKTNQSFTFLEPSHGVVAAKHHGKKLNGDNQLFGGLTEIAQAQLAYKLNSAEDLKKMSLPEIQEALASLDNVVYNITASSVPGAVDRLRDLQGKLNQYLYRRDPRCMDFLDWHEARPGHRPTPRC